MKGGVLSISKKDVLEARNPEASLASKGMKSAQEIINATNSKIIEGLSRPTASSGTPIEDLSGGARFMAQLSNIGGGSLATGGGGIRDGFNTIAANIGAKGYNNAMSQIESDQHPPLLQDDEQSRK